jgi:predicted alpha/beta superfamily hydrolase
MIGTLDQYPDFPSRHIRPRRVDVWRPSGYAVASDPLSVLYMHDGQNVFHHEQSITGIDWGLDETLDKLIAGDQVRPTLVVGIWNTEQRRAEYLPQSPFDPHEGRLALKSLYVALDDKEPDPKLYENGPDSDAYLRFLAEELKPFIDQNYHTTLEQAQTFIMGSSMGGLVSLYAVCQYPELFGGAGCLSTHWPAVGAVIDGYLTTALPSPGRHRFYFDYGTATLDSLYEPYQQRVDAVLATRGYTSGRDWITRRFEGAEHNEAAWRERLHIPLRFLLG